MGKIPEVYHYKLCLLCHLSHLRPWNPHHRNQTKCRHTVQIVQLIPSLQFFCGHCNSETNLPEGIRNVLCYKEHGVVKQTPENPHHTSVVILAQLRVRYSTFSKKGCLLINCYCNSGIMCSQGNDVGHNSLLEGCNECPWPHDVSPWTRQSLCAQVHGFRMKMQRGI